jgi:hypothetical protein
MVRSPHLPPHVLADSIRTDWRRQPGSRADLVRLASDPQRVTSMR